MTACRSANKCGAHLRPGWWGKVSWNRKWTAPAGKRESGPESINLVEAGGDPYCESVALAGLHKEVAMTRQKRGRQEIPSLFWFVQRLAGSRL